jgi:50S ribosomal subunit-associated GTPase HflX
VARHGSAELFEASGRFSVCGQELPFFTGERFAASELARLLMRSSKPIFLAVNKIDTDKQNSLTGEAHRLGIREVFPISAEHGRGIDDLIDAFCVRAMSDQDDLELALPRTQCSEDGLSAFKMRHTRAMLSHRSGLSPISANGWVDRSD